MSWADVFIPSRHRQPAWQYTIPDQSEEIERLRAQVADLESQLAQIRGVMGRAEDPVPALSALHDEGWINHPGLD